MEPFNFNDLRHSLPSLQASRPSTLNAHQSFYLPVAAQEASSATCSGSDFNALRPNLPSLANSSDSVRNAYQSPYPSAVAQQAASPATARKDTQPSGLRVNKLSNKAKQRKAKREGWYLKAYEAKAFKALEKDGRLPQMSDKDKVAFFRENIFGKKEYGWATNSEGPPEWSYDRYCGRDHPIVEVAAASEGRGHGRERTRKKKPQNPVKYILVEEDLESQPNATLDTAVLGDVAMDTDTAEHTPVLNLPLPNLQEMGFESLGRAFLDFLNNCTETEVARIGKDGFINELALTIGKAEADKVGGKFNRRENERQTYDGLTYGEHKSIEKLQSIPYVKLVISTGHFQDISPID